MAQQCEQCGICCRIFLINLTEEEYYSDRFETLFGNLGRTDDFSHAESACMNTLAQRSDGSCIYLVDDKCSIHNDRPLSCRDFYCSTTDERFQEMCNDIIEYKHLLNGSESI